MKWMAVAPQSGKVRLDMDPVWYDELLAEYLTRLPQIRETFLPDTNHYSSTLGELGVSADVRAIQTAYRKAAK